MQSLIRQTPITCQNKTPICPWCDSVAEKRNGSATALAGTPDPNHYWWECWCDKCKRTFTQEYKYDNIWYTLGKIVLKGVANCYEDYVYDCKECDGKIHRKYTELDGVTAARGLCTRHINGKWVKDYRTFYYCDKCGISKEI